MDQQQVGYNHRHFSMVSAQEEEAVAAIRKATGYTDAQMANRIKVAGGHIVEIDFSYCYRLHDLPREIVLLSYLKSIDLSWCGKLKTLPKEICKIENLNRLALSCCEGLEELPQEIGDLQRLTCLSLYACTKLKSLPPSIGKLSKLTGLYLSNCEELARLPSSIGGLKLLTNLSLNNCRKLEVIPPEMGEMKNLTCLNFSNCGLLVTLPEELSKLSKLSILSVYLCNQLQSIPPKILKLPELKQLVLCGCTELDLTAEDIGRYSYSLEEVLVDEREPELDYYLKLNKAGRFLLREEENSLTDVVWTDLFAKTKDIDCLYYFLQARPHLLATASVVEKEKPSSAKRKDCPLLVQTPLCWSRKEPSTSRKQRSRRWLSWKRSCRNK